MSAIQGQPSVSEVLLYQCNYAYRVRAVIRPQSIQCLDDDVGPVLQIRMRIRVYRCRLSELIL